MEKLYLDVDDENKASQIVDAIYKATNGTFIGDRCISTLLGIPRRFDEQGREVTQDINTHCSSIILDNVEYGLVTKNFKCVIVKPRWKDKIHQICAPYQCLIAKVDFEPVYDKEYWEKLKKKYI